MQMYSNIYGKSLPLLLSDKMCCNIIASEVFFFNHLRLTYNVANLVNNIISIKKFKPHTASATLATLAGFSADCLVDGEIYHYPEHFGETP